MHRLWPSLLVGCAAILTARAEAPLPPIAKVLQAVVNRSAREAENDRAFAATYHYVKSKVTDYSNARGILTKRETKTSTNNPVATPAVPPPETTPARKPENAQIASETNSLAQTREFDKQHLLATPDLLARFDFRMVGRETISGRAAFVVDFLPKQTKQPELSFKDKFINKAAGRVWVDETEFVVVKGDLYLAERVNVFGGLVGAVWKFTFNFTRERTSDGLWYVRDSHWHLEGREVIFNVVIDCHETKTEVRKAITLVQR